MFTKFVHELDGGEVVEHLIWSSELPHPVVEGYLFCSDWLNFGASLLCIQLHAELNRICNVSLKKIFFMSYIYIVDNHGTHLLCSSDSLMARAAAAEAAVTAPAVRHHLAPS